VIPQPEASFSFNEDDLAAVAFLAGYGGTVEAYRHDLRA
jgi:hypothetical protein